MNHDFLPVHLIQTFVAFVESANITEAAGKIGLSQPAVSVHLRKFEEMLPETVFEMRGKRKVLSPYGQSLYDVVAPEFHKVVRRFSEASRSDYIPLPQVIRVGGARSLTSLVVPSLKLNGRVQVIELKETEVLGELQSGRIHYGIVQNQIRLKGVKCEAISSIQFDLVSHVDLVQTLEESWLLKNNYLAHADYPTLANQLMSSIGASGSTKEPAHIYNDWFSILQGLVLKKGYSIVPHTEIFKDKCLLHNSIDGFKEVNVYLLSVSK